MGHFLGEISNFGHRCASLWSGSTCRMVRRKCGCHYNRYYVCMSGKKHNINIIHLHTETGFWSSILFAFLWRACAWTSASVLQPQTLADEQGQVSHHFTPRRVHDRLWTNCIIQHGKVSELLIISCMMWTVIILFVSDVNHSTPSWGSTTFMATSKLLAVILQIGLQ